MKVQKHVLTTNDRNDLLDAVGLLIAKNHGFDVSASATAWAVSVLERVVLRFEQTTAKQLRMQGFETEV